MDIGKVGVVVEDLGVMTSRILITTEPGAQTCNHLSSPRVAWILLESGLVADQGFLIVVRSLMGVCNIYENPWVLY